MLELSVKGENKVWVRHLIDSMNHRFLYDLFEGKNLKLQFNGAVAEGDAQLRLLRL